MKLYLNKHAFTGFFNNLPGPFRELITFGISELANDYHNKILQRPETKAAWSENLCNTSANLADIKSMYPKHTQEKTKQEYR